jgi:hypothetical protein
MDGPGHMSTSRAPVVDSWPVEATLRAVVGDPFAFRLVLRGADGDPVDVSLWEWRGTVTTGPIRLDFESLADDTGVRLWLRGDETARLGRGEWPYDVACRQPSAGEGVTVLRGMMALKPRVSDPIRHDPDVVPAEEVPA